MVNVNTVVTLARTASQWRKPGSTGTEGTSTGVPVQMQPQGYRVDLLSLRVSDSTVTRIVYHYMPFSDENTRTIFGRGLGQVGRGL